MPSSPKIESPASVLLAGERGLSAWGEWFSGLHAASFAHRRDWEGAPAQRLQCARAFIDANFAHPLDLEMIARRAHFSRFHFHRRFREYFGATPHEYLTRKRVERAQSLLRESKLSVTEVCLEVGFQSLGSFSSMFQRHVGHSPSRYRRSLVQCQWQKPVAVPWCFLAVHRAAN